MGSILTNVLNQLVSRQVQLGANETRQGMQSNLEVPWRLIVNAGIDSDINIQIQVSNQSSSYTITSSVSRGSGMSFTGFGAMVVNLTNNTVNPVLCDLSLDHQTTEMPSYQLCTNNQVINNAGFTIVNSDTVAGFAPPFCRYVRLFTNFNIDVRFIDQAGNEVGRYNNLAPEDMLLNELHVPPFARVEVQSVPANANLMAVWF